MQGCHPPSPPTPWYPPLPVKWVIVLLSLVAFPVWSCLAASPPPLWSGACGLFGCPRPAFGVPLVSSNVILTCLVPSPPCGVGPVGGAVCSTETWYGCCRLLAVISSLRARYHTKYDVALFTNGVLHSCEEALAGIILHRPPSLWFAWVRSGLGAGAAWGPGREGGYHWGGGGGWGPGTREHL